MDWLKEWMGCWKEQLKNLTSTKTLQQWSAHLTKAVFLLNNWNIHNQMPYNCIRSPPVLNMVRIEVLPDGISPKISTTGKMELFAPMDCVVGLESVSVDIKIHVITVTNECVWDCLNPWHSSMVLYSNFSPYATSSVNIRFSSFVFQISSTTTRALSGGQRWNSVIGAVNPPSNWSLVWKSVNQTSLICVGNQPISNYQAWSNFSWRSWGNSICITGRRWHSYFPSLPQVGLSCFEDLYDMHILWIDFCRFTIWKIVCGNFFPFPSPSNKYRAPGVCLHLRFKLDIKGNCCPVCGSNGTTAGKLASSPDQLLMIYLLSQHHIHCSEFEGMCCFNMTAESAALRGTFDIDRTSFIH